MTKATDNYKKVWVVCRTWNWSHPYENIPGAQGERNGTAGGSTRQFHLQNDLIVSKAL